MEGEAGRWARFAAIRTPWTLLEGPADAALGHLYRVYGGAALNYTRGRLARGDFPPLRAQDADDLLQEFFLRLATTGWLKKPDRSRGAFRPFFVRRLVYFLREKRKAQASKPETVALDERPDPAAPDLLEIRLEREWKVATVYETLARIGTRNASWQRVLHADLHRGENDTDGELAARVGLSLSAFRSQLKRARPAFAEVYRSLEARLDRGIPPSFATTPLMREENAVGRRSPRSFPLDASGN